MQGQKLQSLQITTAESQDVRDLVSIALTTAQTTHQDHGCNHAEKANRLPPTSQCCTHSKASQVRSTLRLFLLHSGSAEKGNAYLCEARPRIANMWPSPLILSMGRICNDLSVWDVSKTIECTIYGQQSWTMAALITEGSGQNSTDCRKLDPSFIKLEEHKVKHADSSQTSIS